MMSVELRRAAVRRAWPISIIRAMVVLVAGAVFMTACQTSNLGVDRTAVLGAQPTQTAPTPNPNGEVFGNGAVRVSLLLPKTAPGK